ncbi:unnamed protein product [marine sediment metagenome]|uniref:Uncharacterized protein n=1 Tax=marine sediment metagenome TaxID=412755 RepID=X0RLM8_9ZZZZ
MAVIKQILSPIKADNNKNPVYNPKITFAERRYSTKTISE